MRLVTPILLTLLLLLQHRIWLGRNSLPEHRELIQAVTAQKVLNEKLMKRNELLEKEIQDLKQGYNAIEERARNELGFIKKGEVFYRLHQPSEITRFHD